VGIRAPTAEKKAQGEERPTALYFKCETASIDVGKLPFPGWPKRKLRQASWGSTNVGVEKRRGEKKLGRTATSPAGPAIGKLLAASPD